MNWYLEVLKKYAVFSGRARRKEYWMFVLFNFLVTLLLFWLDGGLGTRGAAGYGLLSGLYSLAVLLPGLGVSVRRLHDTGRSGWWLLVGLIPILGVLILLFFMVQDSEPGENQFGANPKLSTAA
jgi:uncharacterized membrane protein YhaH (DUF805 family)